MASKVKRTNNRSIPPASRRELLRGFVEAGNWTAVARRWGVSPDTMRKWRVINGITRSDEQFARSRSAA